METVILRWKCVSKIQGKTKSSYTQDEKEDMNGLWRVGDVLIVSTEEQLLGLTLVRMPSPDPRSFVGISAISSRIPPLADT